MNRKKTTHSARKILSWSNVWSYNDWTSVGHLYIPSSIGAVVSANHAAVDLLHIHVLLYVVWGIVSIFPPYRLPCSMLLCIMEYYMHSSCLYWLGIIVEMSSWSFLSLFSPNLSFFVTYLSSISSFRCDSLCRDSITPWKLESGVYAWDGAARCKSGPKDVQNGDTRCF